MKNWVNILFYRFKVSMSMALDLFIDETYTLDNAWAQQLLAQYVRAIMQHCIRCNIVNIANQLSFAYQSLAPELRVFVSPSTEFTKAADFICMLEEKQEVWHEIMATTIGLKSTIGLRYYNPLRRLSPHRLPLLSQSGAFSCYQAQYWVPQLQQPWQPSERGSDLGQSIPLAGP